ncbi:MAG: GNAT family N-acetyltransferase [Gammaproteobacteria bacterium]|nr:GNAT family N-acetyltransferase [Gammaproteobacteria bacterium]
MDPNWQRKGIGQLLWEKILQRAKAQMLTSLHLEADPFAVPFYKSIGFTIKGEVPSGSIAGRYLPHMIFEIDQK